MGGEVGWGGKERNENLKKATGVWTGLSERSSPPLHPIQKHLGEQATVFAAIAIDHVHGWPSWGLTDSSVLPNTASLCVIAARSQAPTNYIPSKGQNEWPFPSSLCLCSPNLGTAHLQNFLRCQNNKTNYNLVCETLQFLDCICGSTTGGLGLLGLYINEKNVALINQTLESLTEYCQGRCHENQVNPFAFGCGKKSLSFWNVVDKD